MSSEDHQRFGGDDHYRDALGLHRGIITPPMHHEPFRDRDYTSPRISFPDSGIG
jgi:hypothetical protein